MLKDLCETTFEKMRQKYPTMTTGDLQTVATFISMLIEADRQPSNVYIENGYKNRADYLRSMSDEYCVPIETVHVLATTLGPNEDFDGLVSALQDIESEREYVMEEDEHV